MNDTPLDSPLDSPLHTLRAATARLNAPPGVEKELMAAFAKQFPRKRWYQRLSGMQWGVAGGLGSAAVVVLVFMLSLHAPVPMTAGDQAGDDGNFIALASRERIELETTPQMVETTVPRTALASMGVPVTPENAGDSVRAEMLIGADGQPLALRLLAN